MQRLVAADRVHHLEVGEQHMRHFMIEEALNGVAQLVGGVVGDVGEVHHYRAPFGVGGDGCCNSPLSYLDTGAGENLRDLPDGLTQNKNPVVH